MITDVCNETTHSHPHCLLRLICLLVNQFLLFWVILKLFNAVCYQLLLRVINSKHCVSSWGKKYSNKEIFHANIFPDTFISSLLFYLFWFFFCLPDLPGLFSCLMLIFDFCLILWLVFIFLNLYLVYSLFRSGLTVHTKCGATLHKPYYYEQPKL